jgi:tetratricopeptide (TPR) repeat protein
LGTAAHDPRQWPQAEGYYQQALQIYIEYKDGPGQARLLHSLGMVAQAQRQWPQAEGYYQQALQIYIEYKDRYSQASTYHQLGMVAEEQRQWPQAYDYYLRTLEIDAEYQEQHNIDMSLRSLTRLWQAAPDEGMLAKVAAVLGVEAAALRELFEGAAEPADGEAEAPGGDEAE